MPGITDQDDFLQILQDDIVARLQDDEYFISSGIPVFSERKTDIANEIARALSTFPEAGGVGGICAIVLSPEANVQFQNVSNCITEAKFSIRVLEDVLINTGDQGTGKPALSVAKRITRILNHFTPHGYGGCFVADTPTIAGVEDPIAPLAYEVRFRCNESSRGRVSKVAIPVITTSGSLPTVTVTITCATDGATIRYTTDGSYPNQTGLATSIYSAPFTVAEASSVRASAIKTGMIGSDVQVSEIS